MEIQIRKKSFWIHNTAFTKVQLLFALANCKSSSELKALIFFRLNTSYKLDSKKVVDTCNVEELGKITFLKVIPGYCTQYRGLLSCAVPVVYNC